MCPADVDNIPKIIIDEQPPLLKLLCGADLLESFGTPGLWADEDVSNAFTVHNNHICFVCLFFFVNYLLDSVGDLKKSERQLFIRVNIHTNLYGTAKGFFPVGILCNLCIMSLYFNNKRRSKSSAAYIRTQSHRAVFALRDWSCGDVM